MAADILGIPNAAEVSTELAEGRAAWLALAVDTWRVTKPGAETAPAYDENGTRLPAEPVVVYEGPGRLQIRADANSNIVEVTAGEKESAYQTAILALPITTPAGATGNTADITIDMTATCVAAPNDPALAGRVFQIRALMHKTHATARRVRVTETVG